MDHKENDRFANKCTLRTLEPLSDLEKVIIQNRIQDAVSDVTDLSYTDNGKNIGSFPDNSVKNFKRIRSLVVLSDPEKGMMQNKTRFAVSDVIDLSYTDNGNNYGFFRGNSVKKCRRIISLVILFDHEKERINKESEISTPKKEWTTVPSREKDPGVFAARTDMYYNEKQFVFRLTGIPGKKEYYSTIIKYTGSEPEITIPDTMGGHPLKVIGDMAFSGCEFITLVKLPRNLTEIGESAFSFCRKLERADLPARLEIIGAQAFAQCRSLKKLVLPDSVRRIGKKAFKGCKKLSLYGDGKLLRSMGFFARLSIRHRIKKLR